MFTAIDCLLNVVYRNEITIWIHNLKLTNLRGTPASRSSFVRLNIIDYSRSVWKYFGKIQVCMFIRWHLRSCGLHRVHIIAMVHWLNRVNSNESDELRCHVKTRVGDSDEVLHNEIYYCVGYQIEIRWINRIRAKMDFTWTLFLISHFLKNRGTS